MTTTRRRPSWLALIFMASLALGATPALAQPAELGGDPEVAVADPAEETSPTEMRQRIRQRIRVMRAWRLTEVIDLDEATAVRLFDHLDAFDDQIFAQEERLGELGRQLREGLEGETTDSAVIRELVEEITATHLRVEELRVQMVLEAGAFLDARQQAALMLFVPEFDRQIQQIMREARRERGERFGRPRRGRSGEGPPPGGRHRPPPR